MKRVTFRLSVFFIAFISLFLTAFSPGDPTKPGNDSNGGNATQAPSGTPLNLVWQEMGPNNLGTYCRAIAVDANSDVWAGSTAGGLFKSTNQGASWVSVTGIDENLAVSSIAIDGDDIYVGTGDLFFYRPNTNLIDPFTWNPFSINGYANGFHQYAGAPGEGVFVSTDGGSSWSHNNGTWSGSSVPFNDVFMSIQKIVTANSKTFVASLAGLYWSSDKLATVTKSIGTPVFMSSSICDVELGKGNTVWAATKDSLYKSTDGGLNFGTGINKAGVFPDFDSPPYNKLGGDRIEIAVSPLDNNVVFVTGANDINSDGNGVWKSIDNGANWLKVAPTETSGGTAFAPFDGESRSSMLLQADPVNPEGFFVGGARLYRYTDATGLVLAASHNYFPGFSTRYVPVPVYMIAWDPNDSQRFYVAGQEEIVRTDNDGMNFSFKTKGFNAGRTYNVSAAPNWEILASERVRGVIKNSGGGAGSLLQQFATLQNSEGYVQQSQINLEAIVAQDNVDGGLMRSLSGGLTWESFYGPPDSTHPFLGSDSLHIDRSSDSTAGGNLYDDGGDKGVPIAPWIFDEVIDPASLGDDSLIMATKSFVFFCSNKFVWFVTGPFEKVDSVSKWTRVSNALVSSRGSGPIEYLTAIEVSGDDNHVVYVGTNYGRLYRIWGAHEPHNLDASRFLRIDTLAVNSSFPDGWITDIEVDPSDNNNMVVTFGGYDTSSISRVWITNNAMDQVNPVSFWDAGANLSPASPVYTAAFHPDASLSALIIGTQYGVFTSTDNWASGPTSLAWNQENSGMATVPVYDINIRPYYMALKSGGKYSYAQDHTMFIATHGRGIYKSATLVSREENEGVIGQNLELNIQLYPNPTSGVSTIELTLEEHSQVHIEVWALNGRRVGTLTNEAYNAGTYELTLDLSQFESGMYLVKAIAQNNSGTFTKTLKSIVIK